MVKTLTSNQVPVRNLLHRNQLPYLVGAANPTHLDQPRNSLGQTDLEQRFQDLLGLYAYLPASGVLSSHLEEEQAEVRGVRR